jgi:hypothetical protein
MKLSIGGLLVARRFRRGSRLDDQCRDCGKSRLGCQNRDVPQVTDRTVVTRLRLLFEMDRTRDDEGEGEEDAHRGESTPEPRDHVVPRN